MNWKRTTKIFLLVLIVVIFAYDVLAIVKGGKAASISWFVISDLKKDYPLLNDMFWFTMGHLFWNMKDPTKGKEDEQINHTKNK
jgi:hypothetical protein